MEKLNSIIQKIFKVKPEDINDKMSPDTIPDWDSMNYLLFISELEKEFDIQFTVDETMDAKNLGDIKRYLKNNGVEI